MLGLNLMQSGLFSVLPWVSMSFCANAGGWIADYLVPKIGVTYVRKLMQSVSLFLLITVSLFTGMSFALFFPIH